MFAFTLLTALAVASTPTASAPVAADLPSYAIAGWTKPAEVERGCVGRSVRIPEGITASGKATVKFAVSPDGAADRVELISETPRLVGEAIVTAVKSCRFTPGRTPDGTVATVWAIMPLRFSDEPGGAGPAPGPTPSEVEPGCIARTVRLPPNRLLRGVLAIDIRVSPEGKALEVSYAQEIPLDVRDAFRNAIDDCALTPGRSAAGTAVEATLHVRINFGQPSGDENAAGLKREARLHSPTCLNRLRPFGMYGHVQARVRVSETGVPSDFRLSPENIPSDFRMQIMDVLGTCTWDPAIGPDDRPVAADASVTIRYR